MTGRIFLKLQAPIGPPSLVVLLKKFVRELSVLSGNNSPEVLEINSLVNDFFVE